MSRKSAQKYKKLFLVTFVAVIVYVVLKYLLPLVLPFVLAYFICRLFYPWALRLWKKTHIPLGICSALCVGLFSLAVVAVIGLAGWYLLTQLGQISGSFSQLGQWMNRTWDQICTFLSTMAGDEDRAVYTALCAWGESIFAKAQEKIPEFLAGAAADFLRGTGKFFVIFVVAAVGSVLLMKNKQRIKRQLLSNIFAREITSLTARIYQVSAGFFRCQLTIIGIIAVILSLGLTLSGSHYGVLLGIIIAFLDALPVIGSGTVLLPWAVFVFLNGSYVKAAVLVILYVLATIVREVLEPRLMGNKLGINEFYMLMATFTGLALFGVWGIFLGPLGMVMILEILKQLEDLYAEYG